MTEKNRSLSDVAKQFFIEKGINQVETATHDPIEEDSNTQQFEDTPELQSEQSKENIEVTSNSPKLSDYIVSQNAQPYLPYSVYNYCQENMHCIGKYVRIQNANDLGFIGWDIYYTPILYYNGQAIAYVQYQNSEFVVYQNGYRSGTIIGNLNEPIWQFIPDNMHVSQQQGYNTQVYSSTNAARNNIILNNVPADKVTETYNFVNNFVSNSPTNVCINFAGTTSQTQEITASNYKEVIDVSPK